MLASLTPAGTFINCHPFEWDRFMKSSNETQTENTCSYASRIIFSRSQRVPTIYTKSTKGPDAPVGKEQQDAVSMARNTVVRRNFDGDRKRERLERNWTTSTGHTFCSLEVLTRDDSTGYCCLWCAQEDVCSDHWSINVFSTLV